MSSAMKLDLLSEIRDFLAETGMGRSYFGKRATGNSELVQRLEAGGSVTLVTAAKVREFMAEQRKRGQAA